MNLALAPVMRDVLTGWQEDLDPAWRRVAGGPLGFDDIDPALSLEPWEPIFPARKGRIFPGAPAGAHMLRAFEGIAPEDVGAVVLGQDPYPCPAFATGRAFEAGNVAEWRELEKMFSVSVRAFMQLIVAARTGDPAWAGSTADWPRLRRAVEAGTLALEPAAAIAGRWVGQGVLLLNSALTLSRFAVAGDPHQLRGHLPLWRPLIRRVLAHLAGAGRPIVFLAFGGQAEAALAEAGIAPGTHDPVAAVLRPHPAAGDALLALENPFLLANRHLARLGARPVEW
jgi:uracil-DNA glycosylase